MRVTSKTRLAVRPSHLSDYVFSRVRTFQRAYEKHPQWTLNDPIEDLEFAPALTAFCKEFSERQEWDYRTFRPIGRTGSS